MHFPNPHDPSVKTNQSHSNSIGIIGGGTALVSCDGTAVSEIWGHDRVLKRQDCGPELVACPRSDDVIEYHTVSYDMMDTYSRRSRRSAGNKHKQHGIVQVHVTGFR